MAKNSSIFTHLYVGARVLLLQEIKTFNKVLQNNLDLAPFIIGMGGGGIELLSSLKYDAYTENTNLICYVYSSSK